MNYGNPGSTDAHGISRGKEVFPAPYRDAPQNDWGVPENLPASSDCTR